MWLFAPLFSQSVWGAAVVLVVGTILAPGKRTVSALIESDGAEPPRAQLSKLPPRTQSGGLV